MAKSGGDKHEKNAEISSFLLEWFGRGAQFVKYIYHINKS